MMSLHRNFALLLGFMGALYLHRLQAAVVVDIPDEWTGAAPMAVVPLWVFLAVAMDMGDVASSRTFLVATLALWGVLVASGYGLGLESFVVWMMIFAVGLFQVGRSPRVFVLSNGEAPPDR